jgi:hypothetical protein
MEGLSVRKLSPKSLAKLKRGHPVRLMQGEGTQLCVSPEKFNHITRSFTKGRGVNMSLSPEEVSHNHGKGLFDKIKSGVSAIAHSDVVKKVGKKVADKAVDKAIERGEKYLDKKLSGEGMRPHEVAGSLDQDIMEKINELTGQKLGALAKSNAVQAGARMLRANMQRAHSHSLANSGMGLYASSPSMGEGMYAGALHPRQRIAEHHKKLVERGTVGMGGNLLGMNPALMSQPYSANFQFASRLPPAYANQIKQGGGLY